MFRAIQTRIEALRQRKSRSNSAPAAPVEPVPTSVPPSAPSIGEILSRFAGAALEADAPRAATPEPTRSESPRPQAFAGVQRRTGVRVASQPGSPAARVFTEDGPVFGYDAALSDISAAGCGLVLEGSLAEPMKIHRRILVRIALPDDPETYLELGATILRSMAVTGALRLGLRFCFDAPNASVLQCRLRAFAAKAS